MAKIFACYFVFHIIAAGSAIACSIPGDTAELRTIIVERVNAERKRAGIPALSRSGALRKAAQNLACDNADQEQWSHTGRNGSDLRARLKSAGYRFRAANENVGRFRSADRAVTEWMGSRPHRANILSPAIRAIGVGVAVGRDGRAYWVMVGGRAR